MDKHIVVHSYNGILLSNKKEWPTDTHNDMGKFQNNAERSQTKKKEAYTAWFHLWETPENVN